MTTMLASARRRLLPLLMFLMSAACGDDSSGTGNQDNGTPMNGATGTPGGVPGFLRAQGAQLVDHQGQVVRLTGVNWFGLETEIRRPGGLQLRSMDSILDQVVTLGFNSLRVPFSTQALEAGATPQGIDYALNPDLMNRSPLEILDVLVQKAGARGLKVVLDRHRIVATGQSALWYNDQYPESRWIEDWVRLAERYKNDPTVIGVDLHNEPHDPATWGDDNQATDWRLAAERAGEAILAVNPNLLIIVEGVRSFMGQYYWDGGNLRGARDFPVRLSKPEQRVYSTHDYPASLYAQPWFSAPNYPANLAEVWRQNWGYLVEENLAPVWVGEFGTRYLTPQDQQWMGQLATYIQSKQLSFAFWCLNPESGDTGGILQDDWQSVQTQKMAVLTPLLAPLIP